MKYVIGTLAVIVGIELRQICVLVATFVAFTAIDRLIAAARASRTHWGEPLRIRTVTVSSSEGWGSN